MHATSTQQCLPGFNLRCLTVAWPSYYQQSICNFYRFGSSDNAKGSTQPSFSTTGDNIRWGERKVPSKPASLETIFLLKLQQSTKCLIAQIVYVDRPPLFSKFSWRKKRSWEYNKLSFCAHGSYTVLHIARSAVTCYINGIIIIIPIDRATVVSWALQRFFSTQIYAKITKLLPPPLWKVSLPPIGTITFLHKPMTLAWRRDYTHLHIMTTTQRCQHNHKC